MHTYALHRRAQSNRATMRAAVPWILCAFLFSILLALLGQPSPSGLAIVRQPQSTSSSSPSFPVDVDAGLRGLQLRQLPIPNHGYDALRHLVVVPCHGTFRANDYTQYTDDDAWGFEPYQRGHGLPSVLAAHIRRALSLAAKDPEAVVIFSGGETRLDSAARSEAQSYLDLAVANRFDGIDTVLPPAAAAASPSDSPSVSTTPFRRVFTEEFARDSFENLLFAIARFAEVTGGRFPSSITVVGFQYKAKRFTELHRMALRYPADHFRYVGIDEAALPSDKHNGPVQGKLPPLSDAATMNRVRSDLYGCGAASTATRQKRNPNRRTIPYYGGATTAALRGLLAFCGTGTSVYRGALPWTTSKLDDELP